MKKITNYLLIAATVCGLSLAATSCKDDDNDNGNNGGTTPNLKAQDGTKLTVVKLVENPYLYNNNVVPMINWMLRNNYQQSLIFLDNQPYESDYKF